LGMRLNFWIALIVCLIGLTWFVITQRSTKHGADEVAARPTDPEEEPAAGEDPAADGAAVAGEAVADEPEPATPRVPD
ncbi:MAG: hypothetical protein ACRDNF_18510, partial [Streptosporangiaceae bacterium]